MKLLLLNYEFPPMGGGASNATYNIARELVRLGHSVDVLTSRFGDQAAEETVDGIHVYRVTSWRRGIHDCGLTGAVSYLFFAFFRLRKLLQQDRYDLLHYFFSLPTGLLSLYSNGIKRLPYVVSLRGSDVPGYDNRILSVRILHWFLKPITRHIWKTSRKVTAVSQALRALALRTSPSQPIGVIHNGINTEVFKPAIEKRNYSNGQINLLCVARLIDRKGLNYLLEAFARLDEPRVHLSIVGTGIMEKQLKARTNELAIENKIRFEGFRTAAQIAEYCNRSDIFVLPSLEESFGMVLLEAMSGGLPIIASKVGGVPEIIEHGNNGLLVEPGSVEEITQAITVLMNDAALRERMAANNVSKIRARFVWDNIAREYEDTYIDSLK